jgi:hypothetical protein
VAEDQEQFAKYGEVTVYTDGRVVWDPPDADHTRISRQLLEQILGANAADGLWHHVCITTSA